jgi:uncharacterized YccA/Bax inhibitor family protein
MDHAMTIPGVINKTAILLLIVTLTALYMWSKFFAAGGNPTAVTPWMTFGAIAGLVLAFMTAFKSEWSPVTAPLYAVCEGLFVGGFSAILEASFPGIVIQAISLTFASLFAMLAIYRMNWIPMNNTFKIMVVSATGAIALVYVGAMILGLFGVPVGVIYGNGVFSILFSLFVVAIASLNFVLDFDAVYQGSLRGAPKYMEWYGGFALMVTLIWLYVEFLRLISNVRSRS